MRPSDDHETDEAMPQDPGYRVELATRRVLHLAGTWLGWDGRGRLAEGGGRIFTPHKAIRRYTDHLIDHLAQIEAILAGVQPRENRWLESGITTDADWARFSEADLNEATERLTRLSATFRARVLSAGTASWDRTPGEGEWTIRQITEHVADPWYAEQVGDLTR
jgi:hypothetical protein